MIEARHVSKLYDGKAVLDDVSLTLKPGMRYALVGPSGCGKTTLVRLLTGIEAPDAGTVTGLDKCRVSAVFQEDRLLEGRTAAENIGFATGRAGTEAANLLRQLGIPQDRLDKPVSVFSGGMKRRVALARALLAEHDMLFLDEPYKGLDPETKQLAEALVDSCSKGKTVVLVTHDAQECAGYELLDFDALSTR